MPRTFRSAGVVGLGTMGAGIVEVLARSGLDVVGVEADAPALDRGRGLLERSTERAVGRGKMSDEHRAGILGRVQLTTSMDDLARCDLVVEAVPERLELKTRVFDALDGICAPDAILATNTSSLSVTRIAAATTRPARVVGMHFFNPAPVLRLVEVVRTVVSNPTVVADVADLAITLGKTPVVIGDQAGFIANALLFGYLNHAVELYASGYATRADLDEAMRVGAGYPMGPLALLDLIGLDTAVEILDTMYAHSHDRRHAPVPLLRQMVAAGLTGRKTGQGFYAYQSANSSVVVPDHRDPAPSVPEAARSVRRIAVVGSGTTAAGIAQAAERAGVPVDHGDTVADLHRDQAGLAATDLVVVAVGDDRDAVTQVLTELDQTCPPSAILAIAATGLPLGECAASTTRARAVLGLHLVAPVLDGGLVEVVRTVDTGSDVLDRVVDLLHRGGAHPVVCPEGAGFLVDALLVPYLNDAVRMVESGYATVADVDAAMTMGTGQPMGPFQLLDSLGLEVALERQREIYQQTPEPGYAPASLLARLVAAGYRGGPGGRGFAEYARRELTPG
ncbi:MAG: 3-hydroxyacyl-CoA dehydrogenase family protein [Actinomycetes bacterium]